MKSHSTEHNFPYLSPALSTVRCRRHLLAVCRSRQTSSAIWHDSVDRSCSVLPSAMFASFRKDLGDFRGYTETAGQNLERDKVVEQEVYCIALFGFSIFTRSRFRPVFFLLPLLRSFYHAYALQVSAADKIIA